MDSLQFVLQIGVVAIVVILFGLAFLYAQAAFIVRIRAGVPRVVKGKVTEAFLHDLAELCRKHGVDRGLVRGIRGRQRISLAFSPGIPPTCRQQLRNVWVMHAH